MSSLAILYLLSAMFAVLGIVAIVITVLGRKPNISIVQVLLETKVLLNKENFNPLAQKARLAMVVLLILAFVMGFFALFEASKSVVLL